MPQSLCLEYNTWISLCTRLLSDYCSCSKIDPNILCDFNMMKNRNICYLNWNKSVTFAVCMSPGQIIHIESQQCVCGEDYYQTHYDDSNGPYCSACPAGSTTRGLINGHEIFACGKYCGIFHCSTYIWWQFFCIFDNLVPLLYYE